MDLSALDLAVAGGAGFLAGGINAIAGGGTLVSFPALVALGVPAVQANITNTVALCPGYFGGAHSQRRDLAPQRRRLPWLAAAGVLGGLIGSVVLILTPNDAFRAVVPFLILIACGLLAVQDRLRRWLRRSHPEGTEESEASEASEAEGGSGAAAGSGGPGSSGAVGASAPPAGSTDIRPHLGLMVAVFLASIYGGFFGVGLGIMLLAVLGVFLDDSLVHLNALKSALALVINVTAALFFVFSGKVVWSAAAVMAVTSLLGGAAGGRLATRMKPEVLRVAVVIFGCAVAAKLWL